MAKKSCLVRMYQRDCSSRNVNSLKLYTCLYIRTTQVALQKPYKISEKSKTCVNQSKHLDSSEIVTLSTEREQEVVQYRRACRFGRRWDREVTAVQTYCTKFSKKLLTKKNGTSVYKSDLT